MNPFKTQPHSSQSTRFQPSHHTHCSHA